MNTDTVMEIKDLSKFYDDICVVNQISFGIKKGNIHTILGPNGSGKTTTFLMILGLIKKDGGIIQRSNELGIGYLPENSGFYPNLSAIDHLRFVIEARKGKKPSNEEITQLLEWVGLDEVFWTKKLITYSKGMKQRFGLAYAFANSPKFVILDEPLTNLDPLTRDDFLTKILAKNNEGTTILLSSHVIREVELITDSISIIHRGKIILEGNLIDLARSRKYNHYEIDFFNLDKDKVNDFLLELKREHSSLLKNEPRLIDQRIVIETELPEKINDWVKTKNVVHKFRPVPGLLQRIYSESIGGVKK